ncbi:hypothetical protein [Mucilaginibacter sp.]|uniref:hypothetical protein n=1 Tax=Mucilaginibacter sp. TaxID=1882438 RepID=UPI003D104294
MIKLSLTIAFLSVLSICYGQKTYHLNKDTANYKHYAFMVTTDDGVTVPIYNYAIDFGTVESTKKEYDKLANDTVIIYKLKPGIRLLNFDQLLKKFNIATKYADAPVYVDSAITYKPQTSYYQLSAVRSIKIQKEEGTHLKYISIITIHHVNNPKIADVFINGTYKKQNTGN